MTSKFFSAKEILPKPTYLMLEDTGKLKHAFRYIDDRVLFTADQLRTKFGPAFANTWGLSKHITDVYGVHNYRGWRPMDCKIGAKFSGHKFGQCLDLVFATIVSKKVRQYILENQEDFPFITELETDISWVHFRVGIRNGDEIKVFKP